MKKSNVAFTLIILIIWCTTKVLIHVSNNHMVDLCSRLGVWTLEHMQASQIYFEVSMVLLDIIVIPTSIWLCFGEDIENLIKKVMKKDENQDKKLS